MARSHTHFTQPLSLRDLVLLSMSMHIAMYKCQFNTDKTFKHYSQRNTKCQNCGTLALRDEENTRYLTVVFRCENCKTVRYCDTECQSEDFSRHKLECAGLAAVRKEGKRARSKARKQQEQQSESTKDDDPPATKDAPFSSVANWPVGPNKQY